MKYISINLIIWMVKRNIGNYELARKAQCNVAIITDIKRDIFDDVTKELLERFASALGIDEGKLTLPPEPVELAYLPALLNEYIVGKIKAMSVWTKELGLSIGKIEEIRLKRLGRKDPKLVEAKRKIVEELDESQLAKLESAMGICLIRNDAPTSSNDTSLGADNSAGDNDTLSDDAPSHSDHRQKRPCPTSSAAYALPASPKRNSNKRQQLSDLDGSSSLTIVSNEVPLLARADAFEQRPVSPHQAPSAQPTPHTHEATTQPPLNPELEQLRKDFEAFKQQLNQPSTPEVSSSSPAPDNPTVIQLRAELEAIKQQYREASTHQASPSSPALDNPEMAQMRAELNELKQQLSQVSAHKVSSSQFASSVDETTILHKILGALQYQGSQSSNYHYSPPGFYQAPPHQPILAEQLTDLSEAVRALQRQLSDSQLPPVYGYSSPRPSVHQRSHMPSPYQQPSHAVESGSLHKAHDPQSPLEYGQHGHSHRPVPVCQSGSQWQPLHSQSDGHTISRRGANLTQPLPSISGHLAHTTQPTVGLDHSRTHASNPLPELPVIPSSGQSSLSSQTQTLLFGASSGTSTFYRSRGLPPVPSSPLSMSSMTEREHGNTPPTNQRAGLFTSGNVQSVSPHSLLGAYPPALSPVPQQQSPVPNSSSPHRRHHKHRHKGDKLTASGQMFISSLTSSPTQPSEHAPSSLPQDPSGSVFGRK